MLSFICKHAWLLLILVTICGCPSFDPADVIPGQPGKHLLRFVQMTDIHVTDEESPARLITLDSMVAASWRPQEAYAGQLFDATCREINRIHYNGLLSKNTPVDFVILTGDLLDNAQLNELQWAVRIMDGKSVTPDSGELDGPLRDIAPELNPNLPFKPVGLAKDIPWFVAYGNHDNSALGNFSVDRTSPNPEEWTAPLGPIVADLTGLTGLDPPQHGLVPTGNATLAVLRAGDNEPIDPYTFQLVPELLKSGSVPADPARRFVSRRDYVGEFFDTTSLPVGHGFGNMARLTGNTFYSFRPKRDVPIRIVVLDSVGPEALHGYIGDDGIITRIEFEGFLKPEIDKAQEAGEYVLIASHHPTEFLKKVTALPGVTPQEFTGYLASQPNVIAHICGHVHYEDVIMHQGKYPYPEIITGSLMDYPQRARMMDVYYDDASHTFRIESTFVCHEDHPTVLSGESYMRATADMFFDPQDPDWAQRVSHLDLSDLESILAGGAQKACAIIRQPKPDSAIVLHRPSL